MMEKIEFEVEGTGAFPIDMLRFDRCWPSSEADSMCISQKDGRRRSVRLVRYQQEGSVGITPSRWKSYGWEVQAVLRSE